MLIFSFRKWKFGTHKLGTTLGKYKDGKTVFLLYVLSQIGGCQS